MTDGSTFKLYLDEKGARVVDENGLAPTCDKRAWMLRALLGDHGVATVRNVQGCMRNAAMMLRLEADEIRSQGRPEAARADDGMAESLVRASALLSVGLDLDVTDVHCGDCSKLIGPTEGADDAEERKAGHPLCDACAVKRSDAREPDEDTGMGRTREENGTAHAHAAEPTDA